MQKARLISADFYESKMEFRIDNEVIAKAGYYIILTKEEFEELSEKANETPHECKFKALSPCGDEVEVKYELNSDDYSDEEIKNMLKMSRRVVTFELAELQLTKSRWKRLLK